MKKVNENYVFEGGISTIHVGSICTKLKAINPDVLTSEVNDMINMNDDLPGICITNEEKVVGVITREYLHNKLSGLYGYCLHSNKPISEIMYEEFMSVDYKTPIDIVSKIAMKRRSNKLYDFIPVTKKDKYYGIVTVKDLLEKTMEIEVFNAKHLNPLSGLPGNVFIEQQLSYCIDSQKSYCVLYLDIDNFKAYNDVYGFENGDIVIKCLAELMRKNISREEFIGHIGGDDFISIIYKSDIEKICRNIIRDFDESILKFYNQKDIDNNFIITKNRYGVEEHFPLLSISIAGITKSDINNIYDLAEKASDLKKVCKQKVGSVFKII